MVVGKKKKKKKFKESQYMVSHPETGSDSPIGSDRGRGRDMVCDGTMHLHSFNSMSSCICNVCVIVYLNHVKYMVNAI